VGSFASLGLRVPVGVPVGVWGPRFAFGFPLPRPLDNEERGDGNWWIEDGGGY
jgi:hypothetical protein